ncbi:MAG TPA: formyltetrahydrofolate deformylase [Acidimicrobiales bacterium]|nr:formyltetrahydrofolate deformylase [Acidimicrobiales bacterium]
MTTATLLLSCPDQPGIVAAVADFVFRHGGNIVHADQHNDAERGVFFQRVEFELEGFGLGRADLATAVEDLGARFEMHVDIKYSDERAKTAVLVSREPHCLYDLLARWRGGELPGDIELVISNHPDHADVAAHFGLPYHHLPVTADTKAQQERAVLALLHDHGVELVVLARYMQILSADFVDQFPNKIINIHHSFLPAFVGSRPYHQAHERGVKLVGVTAHYATADLDAGPILAQDVVHTSHRDAVADLVRKGRDLEKAVLARAVLAHLEHRVLVYGNKTVVFS